MIFEAVLRLWGSAAGFIFVSLSGNRLIHGGPWKTAFCPRRTRRGTENGNTLWIHGGTRKSTENCETFSHPEGDAVFWRGRPQGAPLRGDAAGLRLSHYEWNWPKGNGAWRRVWP